MASNAPIASESTAPPGSSLWDSENMEPNADNRTTERIMVVGECSGDSPTTKESLLKLVAEVDEECSIIREPAMEFRNIESYAEESRVAQRRVAAARRKAKRCCCSFKKTEHQRTTANALSRAPQLTTDLRDSVEQLLQVMREDFFNADDKFKKLPKTEGSLIELKASVKGLQNAKKYAAVKAAARKKAEYRSLKVLQRCCARGILPSEVEALRGGDLTTRLIPINPTNIEPCEWILMTLAVVSGIASCILLILSVTLMLDKSLFIVMTTAAALCTLLPLGYVIYKIAKNCIAKRNLA